MSPTSTIYDLNEESGYSDHSKHSPPDSGSRTKSKDKVSKVSTGKRKYHNKSRKGCSTCKKRRVKCDEMRPICRKCEHMGIACGYVDDDDMDSTSTERDKPIPTITTTPPPSSHSSVTTDSISPPLPSQTKTAAKSEFPAEIPKSILDQLPPGFLNNVNLFNLGNLGGLGGLGNLNNLGNLSNLASSLSSLPINLDSLGSLGGLETLAGSLLTPQPEPAKQTPLTQPKPQHSPSISANMTQPTLSRSPLSSTMPEMQPQFSYDGSLNLLDLRLMYHYTTEVWPTITAAGISEERIWSTDIPMLAFNYPFLMHSILAFSATHLSRTEKGLDQCVTCHRGDALRLLREAVLDINSENTDALVASALILIMDSLANASFPTSTNPKSLPASAWIFHVKGAATILTAVWPLAETSRFYKFISVDLGDLGDIINKINLPLGDDTNYNISNQEVKQYTSLECHDAEIGDLYPVETTSPYLITLAYLNKLHEERYKSDFILRVFAFPALLDKGFLTLLMTGDIKAMRIMRSYYKLLRSFTTEMKDRVWFLEGVSHVLPVDVEEYAGGAGGMHMMLDFLGGGPSIVENDDDDPIGTVNLTNRLIDTNNLPSDITSNLDVMQGDNGFT